MARNEIVAVTGNNSDYLYNMNRTFNWTRPGDEPSIPLYTFILVLVFNSLIFIMGIFGNVLVVLVIAKVRNMRTPTNFFLLNLSIADILVLLICQPAALMEFYAKDRWFIGEAMCKLVPVLENGTLSVSIMTMMAVTAERYNAICNPFKRNLTCTVSMTVKVIVVIWLVGFISATPFLVMTDIENAQFYDGTPITVCRTRIKDTLAHVYSVLLFVMFFALPFFILAVMYSKIIHKLSSDTLKLFTRSDQSAVHTLRLRKQVVRMLVVIIVLFFISLFPIRVVALWLIFTPAEQVVSIGLEAFLNLISFARIMMYLNSACNPLVYSLTSTKFKKAFKLVLHRHSRQSRRSTMLSRKQDTTISKDVSLDRPEKPSLVIRLLFSTHPAHFDQKTHVENQSEGEELKVFDSRTQLNDRN